MAEDYDLPVVPGYEVLEQVAAGGRAEIYLAKEKARGELVAVKFLKREDLDDVDKVQAFMDEVELSKLLVHPTIVRVFDGEFAAGLPYLVMEFVDGITLYELLERAKQARRQVPLGVAAYLVANVADALAYAHELCGPDGEPLRLVHRDVSAVNIMVTFDGAVKLLDFGIARSKISSVRTAPGIIKGKLDYLSPEQCSGGTIDATTDIYSLGVVLYELLAGRRPFEEEKLGVQLEKVCKGDRPKVHARRPDVPPRLERIVDRAMAVSKSRRYRAASEMLDDLRAFMGKLPSRPTSSTVAQLLAELVPDKLTRVQEEYGPEDTTAVSSLDADAAAHPRAKGRAPEPAPDLDEPPPTDEADEPPTERGHLPPSLARAPAASPDRRRLLMLAAVAGMLATAVTLGVGAVKLARCVGAPDVPVAAATIGDAQVAPPPEAGAVDAAGPAAAEIDARPADATPDAAPRDAPEAGAVLVFDALPEAGDGDAGDAGDDAGEGAVLDFTDGGGEPGYVTVVTRRRAQLFVRGEAVATTPVERLPLPPGRYRLKVRNRYGVRRQWVRVAAGQEIRVEFRL